MIFILNTPYFSLLCQVSQMKKNCQDEVREADAGPCTSAQGGCAADPTTCKGNDVAVICTATAMVQAMYDENTALQQYLREIGKD